MSALPTGWDVRPIGELGKWSGGGTPSKANHAFWKKGTIPWVSPKDMKRFFIDSAEDHITSAAVAGSATQLISQGSVLLVTRSGILKHSLPVAVNTCEVAINQDLKALSPNANVDPVFIGQQMCSLAQEILVSCAKSGTTVDSIDFERLKAVSVRIPPLPEQKRIVAKVDSLSAKSRRAGDQLDHIPRLVEKYKQAILAVAFRGELTADWRMQRKTHFSSWIFKPWSDAGETLNGRAFPSTDYGASGVRLLRPGNLHASGLVEWTTQNTRFLPSKYTKEFPKHFIRGAEVLINLTAQSLEDAFLGRACLSAEDDEFLLNQRIALFRPFEMHKKYCLYVLKSPAFRAFVDDGLNAGSLIQHVHTKQLAKFVFPIASLAEQEEIVRRIEKAWAWIDRLASEATSARKLIGHLDQAILAKAFRGELVAQDPNDEPASVLLERIRAERAIKSSTKRAPSQKKSKGRKTKLQRAVKSSTKHPTIKKK